MPFFKFSVRALALAVGTLILLPPSWSQTRAWSSDAGVRLQRSLEADMNRRYEQSVAQSREAMAARLRQIDGQFQQFYDAVAEYERLRRGEAQASGGSGLAVQTRPAAEVLQERAENGDVDAMRTLAGGHMSGTGVPRDAARADAWFARAADRGDNFSRAYLGARVLFGESTQVPAAKGLEYLNLAAAANNADALAYLGVAHADGSGVVRNPARAAELLRRAAEGDSPVGLYRYAHALLSGLGPPGAKADPAQAAMWMSRAADTGYPDAVATWGGFLVHGEGVGKDIARGIALVQRAASSGSAKGKGMLGTFHYEGLGVPKDVRAASRLWEEAVAGGYIHPAAHNLASTWRNGDGGFPADPAKARRYASMAAEAGSVEMASLIGRMLLTTEGGAVDLPNAVRWLRAAADAGEPIAQTNLASLYRRGRGVPRDLPASARLFRAAADQGVADAQFWWGRYLMGGVESVAANPVEGVRSLRRAIAQDHSEAMLEVGRILFGGVGPVAANRDEALALIRKAASHGTPHHVAGDANLFLGNAHLFGWGGIPKDLPQALGFYERATAHDDVEATTRLAFIYGFGEGVAVDLSKARTLMERAFATGQPWGLAGMARFLELGTTVPKDLRRALELYERAVRGGGEQFRGDLDRVKKALGG